MIIIGWIILVLGIGTKVAAWLFLHNIGNSLPFFDYFSYFADSTFQYVIWLALFFALLVWIIGGYKFKKASHVSVSIRLFTFIKEQLNRKIPQQQIFTDLKNEGWEDGEISKAFVAISQNKTVDNLKSQRENRIHNGFKHFKYGLIIIIFIFVAEYAYDQKLNLDARTKYVEALTHLSNGDFGKAIDELNDSVKSSLDPEISTSSKLVVSILNKYSSEDPKVVMERCNKVLSEDPTAGSELSLEEIKNICNKILPQNTR